MTEAQIYRLTRLLEAIEKEIRLVKDEMLMAMIRDQELLNVTKYDHTDYHYHPLKK